MPQVHATFFHHQLQTFVILCPNPWQQSQSFYSLICHNFFQFVAYWCFLNLLSIQNVFSMILNVLKSILILNVLKTILKCMSGKFLWLFFMFLGLPFFDSKKLFRTFLPKSNASKKFTHTEKMQPLFQACNVNFP